MSSPVDSGSSEPSFDDCPTHGVCPPCREGWGHWTRDDMTEAGQFVPTAQSVEAKARASTQVRVTLGPEAEFPMPKQGEVVRVKTLDGEEYSFRVTNEPKADRSGRYAIDFEPVPTADSS